MHSILLFIFFNFVAANTTNRWIPDFYAPDDIMGHKLKPFVISNWTRTTDGKELFSVQVTTDMYARRNTAVKSKSANKFILFFGDSYTFGDGLNDRDTIPAKVQKLLPNFSTYNYAVSAYGPQHLFLLSKNKKFKMEIAEKSGSAIYIFQSSNIERLVGTSRELQNIARSPCLARKANGLIESTGNFNQCLSFVKYFYTFFNFLSSLPVINKYYFNFPKLSHSDYEFFCDVIKESENNLKTHYPDIKLITVFHPHQGDVSEAKNCLKKRGLAIIDYKGLYDNIPMLQTQQSITDTHPTAYANEILSKHLSTDIISNK